MKQKVSAIVLLGSFLVLLVHDMIPHHHHHVSIAGSLPALHAQPDPHCGSEAVYQPGLLLCDLQEGLYADDQQECPHHFHHCSLKVLEIIPTNYSELQTQKLKIVNPLFNSYFNNFPSLLYRIDFVLSCRTDILLTGSKNGAISLRAPPSLA